MIQIRIRTAIRRGTSFTQTEIVLVEHAVGIGVGRATTRGDTLLLRTLVLAVDVAVVIRIWRRRRRLLATAGNRAEQAELNLEGLRLSVLLRVLGERIAQVEAQTQHGGEWHLRADAEVPRRITIIGHGAADRAQATSTGQEEWRNVRQRRLHDELPAHGIERRAGLGVLDLARRSHGFRLEP